MIIDFKYGFEHRGFLYGWYKKELYRLPSVGKDNRKHGIKKLKLIKINKSKGYRIRQDMLTISRCVEKTVLIEDAIKAYNRKQIPLIPKKN